MKNILAFVVIMTLLIGTQIVVAAAVTGPQCLPTPTSAPTWTPVPPTDVPPTQVPPTDIPPTEVPPTEIPPTDVPPTEVPPTDIPPTEIPPTQVPPTDIPPTDIPPTTVPPTQVPPTDIPPTQVPPTDIPPTDVPDKTPEPTDRPDPKPSKTPEPTTKPNEPTESQKIVVYGSGIYELYTDEGVDSYGNILIQDGQEINQYRDIEVVAGFNQPYHVPLGKTLFYGWDEQDGHAYLLTLDVLRYGPPIELWLPPTKPATTPHDGGYYTVRFEW